MYNEIKYRQVLLILALLGTVLAGGQLIYGNNQNYNYQYDVNKVYGIGTGQGITGFYPGIYTPGLASGGYTPLGVQQFIPFVKGTLPDGFPSPYSQPIQKGTYQFSNNVYRVQNQVYNPFPGGLVQGFQPLPSQSTGAATLQSVIDYPTRFPIPAPVSIPVDSSGQSPALQFVPSNVQQLIIPGTGIANNLINGPYSWIVNPQQGIPLSGSIAYPAHNHDGGQNPDKPGIFNGFPYKIEGSGTPYRDGPIAPPIPYNPATTNPTITPFPTGNPQTDPLYLTGYTQGYYPSYFPNLPTPIASVGIPQLNSPIAVGNLRVDCVTNC